MAVAVRPTEKVVIKLASRLSSPKRLNEEILHSKCFLLRAFFGESSAQRMMKTKEDAKGHIATSDTFAEVTSKCFVITDLDLQDDKTIYKVK